MLDAFTRSIPDNGGDKFTLAADRSVTTPKNPRRKPTVQRDDHITCRPGDRRICFGSLRQPTLVEDK